MIESKADMAQSTSADPDLARPAVVEAGDVHVLGSYHTASSSGALFHTMRKADGSWLPFGDVKAKAGDPGSIKPVASANIGGNLYVFAGVNGALFHTVRRTDGTWTPFRDISPETGHPGVYESLAAASVFGVLHVAAVARGNDNSLKLVHTLMTPTDAFLPFGDVEGQAGERGGARDVAIMGIDKQLHLIAVFDAAGGTRIMHTIREPAGSWLPFGDVEAMAGNLLGASRVALALAVPGGPTSPSGLHVAVAAKGKLHHTVRLVDGSWLPFGDVEAEAGEVGGITDVSLTQFGSQLHTFVSIVPQAGKGDLHHTIRQSNGTWLPFGDVEAMAGDMGQLRSFSATRA